MADVRLRFRGLALRLSSITMRARAAALDRRITVRVPWWMRVRGPVLSLLSVAAATSAIVLHPRGASAPRIVAASPAPRTAIRPRPRPAILHHAEIRSLDVAPAFARSGNDMIVSYDARGAGGMLTVLDDNGIEKGRYPYNPAGATHIAAPPVDKPAHFRVMLEMRDGSAHARETLGFIVMPSPQPSPAKAASTSGASNDPIANEPLRLGISPANVVSGAPFYVSAANGSGSLQVTLQDSRGTPVASASAASGKSATLTAPYLNSPKTYFLQVTVRRGKSAETLFQPLHIQPAAR